MLIKPRNAPELFTKLFGEVDTIYGDHYEITNHKSKVEAWDAAIEHVFLQKPIQRKTPLTHPTN